MRRWAIFAQVAALVLVLSASARAQCDHSREGERLGPRHSCVVCDALKPRWSARGSVIFMDRVTDGSLVLMQNTANLSEQLNANDFNFDWEIGFDLSLMRKTWDDHGLEIRYLDFGQQEASANVAVSGGSVRIDSAPPVFLPNVQSIDARYRSETYSLEANYHYSFDDTLTYLAGFRYVSLDDDLNAILDANPQTFRYDALTRNDLYGLQVGVIGAPARPILGCLLGSAVAKAGVFGNDASHRGWINTGVANLAVKDSADSAAFVLELGLSAELRISERLSILGGYSALWLESVAIVTDQIASSDFFNGVGSDDEGDAVFHGANLAIQLRL